MGRYKYRRKDVLDRAEVEGMINRAPRLWQKALIAALYLTGARISELLALRRKDVDIGEGEVVVRIPTLKRRKGVGPLERPYRTLTFPRSAPFLDHFVRFAETCSSPEDLIWPLGKQGRVRAWEALKELNLLCSPHLFRHTRLTKLAAIGASDRDLTEWAGWADSRPAGVYVHMGGRRAAELARRMD